MAISGARTRMSVDADAKIKAAVDVIAAHFDIEPLQPVTGRILDPAMRPVREKQVLAEWLTKIAQSIDPDFALATDETAEPTDTEKAVIEMTNDESAGDEDEDADPTSEAEAAITTPTPTENGVIEMTADEVAPPDLLTAHNEAIKTATQPKGKKGN